MNMKRHEIIATEYDEMLDMITCLNIYNGTETPAKKPLSFDEAMEID